MYLIVTFTKFVQHKEYVFNKQKNINALLLFVNNVKTIDILNLILVWILILYLEFIAPYK